MSAPTRRTTTAETPAATPNGQQQHEPAVQSLLDQVLAKTPALGSNPNITVVDQTLEAMTPHVERLLPPRMAGQAPWLVARAANYFRNEEKLKDCPPLEFCRAVLKAAEMGLPLDGKLAYCNRYKGKYDVNPDYKAMIAVARAEGLIKDCQAFCVKEKDKFLYKDGVVVQHEYPPPKTGRGMTVGAYAKFILPDGTEKFEYFDYEDLVKIRNASPARDKQGNVVGPRKDWPDEMDKKGPVRRGMKYFRSTPLMMKLDTAMDVGNDIDAERAMDVAGEPATPHFADEGTPPTSREVLEANLNAVLDRAKEMKLYNKDTWTALMAKFGVVGGKTWTDEQMKNVGEAVQAKIDETEGSGGDPADGFFPAEPDTVPVAHQERR